MSAEFRGRAPPIGCRVAQADGARGVPRKPCEAERSRKKLLVVNTKVAKDLRIALPPEVWARADNIIE